MEARLARLLSDSASAVLVAEVDGRVVGFAALHVMPLLERDRPLCRLTAMAVAPEVQRQGLGRALVEAGEEWAGRRGCGRVEVASRVGRDDAHSFYARLGFEDRPRRFVKALT